MLSHSTQDYKMVQPISGVHEFQQNEGEPDEMLGGHLLHSKIIMHIPHIVLCTVPRC